ncbi:MAG: MauE/DoxX family redox-associated membrane protein [candidate division Zixibacteria bacterium]|mgnify:CR=1 FL=1|nr:MauE/DoxX family redox-associated membrane protein [candidate division Zixibacteria bacterium]
MRRIIDNDYLTMFSRLLIGGIFIYSSIYKIVEPGAFAKSIWFYHLVLGNTINVMALILPWLELFLGLGLIFGIWYRGSVLWANLLTLVFIAALASAIQRGLSIDCGCFKASKAATGSAWKALLFDFGMILFTLQMVFSRSRKWMYCR